MGRQDVSMEASMVLLVAMSLLHTHNLSLPLANFHIVNLSFIFAEAILLYVHIFILGTEQQARRCCCAGGLRSLVWNSKLSAAAQTTTSKHMRLSSALYIRIIFIFCGGIEYLQ
jgi:hypothetical protein